jgi:hypothetical protein
MTLLAGVAGSAYPAAPADSGLAGCTALSGTHPVAASGYQTIGGQFAGSRWPDLRYSGLAYVEIASQLPHQARLREETALRPRRRTPRRTTGPAQMMTWPRHERAPCLAP